MRCRSRLATPSEVFEILESSGSDYALSQTAPFGQALARAFAEYLYQPTVFDFDGGRVLLPLVRVRRKPAFIGCYEGMPLSLTGAPVCVGESFSTQHLTALLQALSPASLLISIGGTSRPVWPPLEHPAPLELRHGETHLLPLQDGFQAVWERSFSGKVRNQCRLAERKGVAVRTGTTQTDYDTYYTLYRASTERWGYDDPPYPQPLFRELSALQGQGVDLKLAYVEDKAVAGILLFRGRRSVLYWSGALLKEYAAYAPNNALLRLAIEEACARGDRVFDFGSSGPLDSVRRFKEAFGARPAPTYSYSYTSATYQLLERGKKALRQLARRR